MTPDELRELTALLESLAGDPSPIFALSEEERVRLLNAAGDLFNPDAESRRQYFRARKRAEKKARVARDESRRDETGIRVARARPVLTSWADGIDEAMVGYEAGWQLDARDVSAWVLGLRRLTQLKREERERLGTLARGVVSGRMSVAKWRAQLEGLYLELAQAAEARRAKWPLRLLRALR